MEKLFLPQDFWLALFGMFTTKLIWKPLLCTNIYSGDNPLPEWVKHMDCSYFHFKAWSMHCILPIYDKQNTKVENKHLKTFITTSDCHKFMYVISGLHRIRCLSVWLLLNLGGKSHDTNWELGMHNRALYWSSTDLGHGKWGGGDTVSILVLHQS